MVGIVSVETLKVDHKQVREGGMCERKETGEC